MLGFLSPYITWNAILNLQLWWWYKALWSNLMLPSATALSNICRTEYGLTMDATKKQLPSRKIVSLALDEWTSTINHTITSVNTYYTDEHWALCGLQLVLATGPNSRVSSGSGSYPELNRCNGFPYKTRSSKSTFLAPTKYLSSDRITTWSIRRLCSFSRSFTSRFQICDPTSICWVAIENPPISLKCSHYFTTIQRISVGLQIWMLEMKERPKLNNLRIDHVMIRSQLKYLIRAKVVGTV
jgi:hypothetical protein